MSKLLIAPPTTLLNKFENLSTREDIADLLEINLKTLNYQLYMIPRSELYVSFNIAKKDRVNIRTIHAPNPGLKLIQKRLNEVLQHVYRRKKPVHGFTNDRSIVTNAQIHAGQRFVFNLDLKDFYKTIHYGRVRGLFMARPYNFNYLIASIFAQLCCFDNQLPQGAPTSPIISNMICSRLDSELMYLASRFESCMYTRYADDITFSISKRVFPKEIAIIEPVSKQIFIGNELKRIIGENRFKINDAKLRFTTRVSQRHIVTGLTANRFPNVSRKYYAQIRAMLHAWKKHGLSGAQQAYETKFAKKARGSFHYKEYPSFEKVVRGKIDFLGQVRGQNNVKYRKFLEQYNDLRYGSIENAICKLESIQDGKDGVEIVLGTAFALAGYGLVTCAHVLVPGTEVSQYNDSTKSKLSKLWSDTDYDLAILRPEMQHTRFLLPSTKNSLPVIGTKITLLGYPNGNAFTRREGRVIRHEIRGKVQYFVIDQDIIQGNSGGPVLDENNRVIGIAARGTNLENNSEVHDFNGVLPISYLQRYKLLS